MTPSSRPTRSVSRIDGNRRDELGVKHWVLIQNRRLDNRVTSPASGATLTTDFELMRAVAASTADRTEELRSLLGGFISRMNAVPQSVWGGMAAMRFRDVVERWNAESARLCQSLSDIADTIRQNEGDLRAAADLHARHISDVTGAL